MMKGCKDVVKIKKDLDDYKYLKIEIENLKKNIYELEHLSFGVASYSEHASRTYVEGSRIEDLAIRVQILRERYETQLLAILELKIEIEDAVQKLPTQERLIITEHYLNGLSWQEVSDKLFISLSWCYKLHNRALKCIAKCT